MSSQAVSVTAGFSVLLQPGGYRTTAALAWLLPTCLPHAPHLTHAPACAAQWQAALRLETAVLSRLVARKMPRLATHLASLDLNVSILVGPWMGAAFVTTLQGHVLLRVRQGGQEAARHRPLADHDVTLFPCLF
jgi:hypothetical protein